MRFTISQRFFFDAAHTLKRHIEVEGSRRIHGHTYHAEVWLAGERDPATGMVIDLGLLRRRLDDNAKSVAVQNRFIGEQEDEKKRVNARFDEERVRLKQLWSGDTATTAR